MTTVFISGSRKISHLNNDIQYRLQNIVVQQFNIIIGDANGVDKLVQKHLLNLHYKNISVFCSGHLCRNNLGNWNIKHVSVNPKFTGRAFYTQKDKEMAAQADYGFILWDGKSTGSLNNITELLKKKKIALVFFFPTNTFYTISKQEDVQKLLQKTSDHSKIINYNDYSHSQCNGTFGAFVS